MSDWTSRIVGTADVDPASLTPHPYNFRVHPENQAAALSGVLGEIGIVGHVLVNQQTGHILDGHLRRELAIEHGQRTVPVAYVDLSPAEEAFALATFDAIGSMATLEAANLDAVLADVKTQNAAIDQLLIQLQGKAGTDERIDPAELWRGMPEFEQPQANGWKIITVHFASEADYEAFSRAINQTLTPLTKSIWYPPLEKRKMSEFQIEDES